MTAAPTAPPGKRLDVPYVVLMRFAVLVFLGTAVIAAQLSSTGSHWWNSHWFWFIAALLVGTTAVSAWRAREREFHMRAGVLESAVAGKTADLDREKQGEKERNRILEMLVSDEPLGSVLDAVLRSIRSQCGSIPCAILTKRGDSCQVLASLDVPGEWLTALRVPHAVPFEVWRTALSDRQPQADPAWNVFVANLGKARAPGTVCSLPLCGDFRSGALLFFYEEGTRPGEADLAIAEVGARLARLAIEQSRLYDGLQYQAHHDHLTGLPNRSLFEESLARSLREANALGRRCAVVFIDLDRFKRINDTLSHRVGDFCLKEVASRLKQALRPGDSVARMGADEFGVIVNDLDRAEDAAVIGTRFLEMLRVPFKIEGNVLESTASAGIAVFPDDGKDSEKLQRSATAALHCAQDLGGDRVEVFSTRNETLDRVRMAEEIRIGLREGYFVVHYQPKVGEDRKLTGFEALVRMEHPVLGRVPPVNFIQVAESSGSIVELGAWVLDEACRQIADWEARGLNPVPVAVNVSPAQICRPDYAQSVEDCLARHGVPASKLELELTESLVINSTGVAQEQLVRLQSLGIRLSIDDFGTGYSSLSYLHRLPIDAIKLDKSFVQSIDTDRLAHRLVQAMVGVAEGLGLNVVAEGVETESQREALLAAGCPVMQGYLFSRPQPAADLEDLLLHHDRAVAPRNPDPPVSVSGDLLRLDEAVRQANAIAAVSANPAYPNPA